MKTLKFLAFFIAAALIFSCEKDAPEKDQMFEAEIEFGITHIMPTGAKDLPMDPVVDPPECPDDLDAVSAEIHIMPKGGDPNTDVVIYEPDVFYVDGKLYTQTIKFELGTADSKEFTITRFLLLNAGGDEIMATPEENSNYAQYVNPLFTIEYDFTVDAFQKTELPIEVLCFIPSDFENFGFNWFQIGQVVVRHFHIFGNICGYIEDVWGLEDFEGTDYSIYLGGDQNLAIDMPAIFKVVVTDLQDNMAQTYYPFDNDNINDYGDVLKVEYPDHLGKLNEFEFEIRIKSPDGMGGFDWHPIYTLYATDAGPITDEDGNELESPILFVVGGCSYDDHHDITLWP